MRDDGGRWQMAGEVAELRLPSSVREVIGRRVERLDADAHTALSAAAAIGRDFDFDLLLAVLDLSEDRLLDLLEQAVSASLLQESSERAGHFTFTHALVQHTLYDDIGPTRRTRLHKRVAEALEEQCGDEPGERAGELARHWVAAVVSAETAGKAVHYARRAGKRALEQLAPDEAARWYGQALSLYDQAPGRGALGALRAADRPRRGPAPGWGPRIPPDAAGRRPARTGAPRHGRPHARRASPTAAGGPPPPASAWSTPSACTRSRRQPPPFRLTTPGEHRCSRCSRMRFTMAAGGSGPARSRPRPSKSPGPRAIRACSPTRSRMPPQPHGRPTRWPERQRVSDELAELVQSLEDPRLSFWAALRRAVVGLQAGERPQVESGLEAMRAVAASVPEPLIAWTRLKLESGWALVRGDLQAAEQWAIEACNVGTAAGEPDAGPSFSGQTIKVRAFQGRIPRARRADAGAGQETRQPRELAGGCRGRTDRERPPR